MSDIAKLNLAVDSSETVIAIKSLEQLAQISAEAEKAAEKLGGATKQQAKRLSELDKAAKANEATERRSIGQVLERARAYTKTAGAEVAALQAAERNRNSTRKLAEEQEKLRNGLSKLLAVIDPLEAKLNKLDDAEAKLHKTFRAGVIDAEKYAESLAKIGAKRNDIVEKQLKEIGEGAGFASEMIKLLGLNSRESQRDLLNLGRAAASGNWSQVQSSMFQITRSSGALSIALSGVGMGIGAVTAGVGVLGYMYYQSYRENQEFNRSLALTGNAAGATTERLTAMSRSIGENITYAANTAKAVQEVARTGKIAADSIEEVALASVQMQQAFGQAVDQTVSEFVRLGEAPSTALLELNDKYHHLTFSVYEQVRALEEQGREEEAMALAQRHHSEQLGIRAEEVIKHIGSIERAYLQAKKGVQDTWRAISDGIAGIGRQKTLAEQLEESEGALRDLTGERQKLISSLNTPFEPNREGDKNLGLSSREMAKRLSLSRDQATAQQQLKEVEAAIEVQQREHERLALEKANEDFAAQIISERDQNDQNRIKALQAQDDYAKQYTKLTRNEELAKAVKEFESLTKNLDKNSTEFQRVARAHQDRMDEINKRHDKSGRSGSGTNSFAAEVARLKARIEEENNLAAAAKNTIAQVSRLNEFERRGMQLRNLAAKETKAANKAKLEELATLNEQAGALVRSNKLTEEAAKERLRYLEGIEKSTERTRDEAQKIRDQARTMGMSKAAFEELTNARIKEQIAQLQGKKGSEEEIKLLKEQLIVREDLVKAIGEHDVAREGYEAQRKAEQEWRKTIENIDDVFRKGFADMLNRGEDSWKSFTKSLSTTFKTAVADEIYKMFMRPFVAQVAVGVGGMLGLAGSANASSSYGVATGIDMLTKANQAYMGISGGMTSSLAKGVSLLGETFGSSAMTSFASGMTGALGSISATGVKLGAVNAASLGAQVGTGTIANSAYSASMGAVNAGGALAAAMPWITGGAAVLGLGLMAHNMMKGETRHGAYMQYDLSAKQAVAKGGPSGGYGGQATIDAATQLFSSTVDTINSVLEGVGAKAQTAWFHGMFESSDKGRGGTFAGGSIQLADGSIVDFGTSKKGDGFGGKSGTAEEMFANLQSEVHFAALEAWKAVGSEMPQVIRDMLADVDVRSLTAEQAQGLVAEISNTVGAVNALSDAFNQMPLENLKNLSFDVAHGLSAASGGLDALSANVTSFYKGFYSEAERQEHLHRQLVDTLGAVNVQLPSSREGFRHLVDSLGEVTEANQATIAALLGAASAADQYYAELERRQAEAYQERQRLEQEGYNSARSHVDKLMSAFKELAQKQIRELEQVSKATDKVANALQKSLNTQISSLTSVSSMLTDMVNELRGGAKLFEMQSAEGWRVIGNTISTGIIPDAEKLRSAVGSIRSDLDDRYYGSIFERQRDQLVLANQLDSINALAKPQLTIAEQQLQVMQDQLAELREGTKRAFELAGLSQAQIAAIKAVDDKTAANVGLTKDQLEALRTGNNASTVLQNLTREQIQGILGVKSEVNGVYGLSAQQLAELSRNTGVANVIKSLTDAQIAALKAVDTKTAKALGLSESQISALQSGNAQALALQGLTREQLQGILGVKSETSSLHGLSQSQIEAMKSVDLSTQSVAELIDHLQKATEAERLASKQIDAIQSQLGTMQAQYEQLRGLNLSMTSLDEGMRLLAVAMKAEQAAKPPASGQSTSFGGRDFQFSSQSAAKNYLLGNTGLLGAFAEEVAKGWASPTDYLKYAQLHYSDYGWAENRNQSVGKNQGRTHKPGGYSEAQAYLAANQDVMTAYLREVKSGGAAGGDRGMLAFVQSHFDQYGRHEMPLRKYARGGDHFGGLRLVGELGPELEVTGPSRIFNANKTQDILRNMSAGPDISGLMQGLIRENQQLRQMYENMMRSMIAMQQRMARVLERWEGDDYPVRVEEMPDKPIVVTVKKEVA